MSTGSENRAAEQRFAVIIAGTRTFSDYALLQKKCDHLFQNKRPTAIICGEARGAGTLGRRYAEERGIPIMSFPADWERYGKKAGYLRNAQMAENADALIAFWDGKSKGTENMINLAYARHIPVRIVAC